MSGTEKGFACLGHDTISPNLAVLLDKKEISPLTEKRANEKRKYERGGAEER